jgi:MSHA biogenesis protein MshK
MAGRVRALLLACLATLTWPAWAQLADPTKPPVVAGSSGDVPGAAAEPVAIGLQSVILRKDGEGRSAAVINGQVVQLGGWLGDARLVKVEEGYIILLGPEGRETLLLTPTAEKKISKVGAGATAQKKETNQ